MTLSNAEYRGRVEEAKRMLTTSVVQGNFSSVCRWLDYIDRTFPEFDECARSQLVALARLVHLPLLMRWAYRIGFEDEN